VFAEALRAYKEGKMTEEEARGWLSHPVFQMHTEGAERVAKWLDLLLAQMPDVRSSASRR
jgi:hypothetical protein